MVAPNFDAMLAREAKRGKELVLNVTFSGVQVAYLATDRELGVLLEIFSGIPQADNS